MSTQTLWETSPSPKNSMECRVWERFPCGLETTCQPIAARGDNDLSWPAQVRDLSVGGVGVVLKRRFERGAGLAIEIPETPSSPGTTLLGRVVHTTSLPGGQWLHGCAFVSQLSEDELKRLLRLGQPESKPVQNGTTRSHLIQGVILEGAQGHGPRRLIRRMHVKGHWPPAPGTVLKVWFGKNPHGQSLLRVERCVQKAGRWHIFYTFVDPPNSEMGQAFGYRV